MGGGGAVGGGGDDLTQGLGADVPCGVDAGESVMETGFAVMAIQAFWLIPAAVTSTV